MKMVQKPEILKKRGRPFKRLRTTAPKTPKSHETPKTSDILKISEMSEIPDSSTMMSETSMIPEMSQTSKMSEISDTFNMSEMSEKMSDILPMRYKNYNSPDFAPSDYHLFTNLKKQGGKRLNSDEEVMTVAMEYLDGEFYDAGIQTLPDRLQKCLNINSDYVEK